MPRAAATPKPEAPTPTPRTVAELLARLGGIPPERVRLVPAPGTATERDVIEARDREDRTCELVEGVLVEKAMGFEESVLALLIATEINLYLRAHPLGIVAGPDGAVTLGLGLVRAPDVCFVSWDRLPGRRPPKAPIPDLAPDLAVEVLSRGNTKAEMDRKLGEYFAAGVRLVWLIEPKKREARVYAAPGRPKVLRDGDALDGGDVLPGFSLPLKTLFDEATRGPGA